MVQWRVELRAQRLTALGSTLSRTRWIIIKCYIAPDQLSLLFKNERRLCVLAQVLAFLDIRAVHGPSSHFVHQLGLA